MTEDEVWLFSYYLLSQNDDTFKLVQVSAVSPDATVNSPFMSSSLTQQIYPNLAADESFYSASNYFLNSESDSTNSAPSQLYLELLRPLDWETTRSYKFVVVAEDNGSPALTGQLELQVVVTDENDNHPLFENKTITITVPENTPEGRRLVQLIAHDPDEGRAGNVIYSLTNSVQTPFAPHSRPYSTISTKQNHSEQSPSLVHVDPHSGWLILVGKLDYEQSKLHLIRVMARDEAGHPGFDEASVHLLVTDVNDVAPIISVDPVVDLNTQQSPRRTLQPVNSLELHVNETPGWTLSDSWHPVRAGPETYSDLSLQNSPLLAFVVVNDPDTGQGGRFQCGLKSVANTASDRAAAYAYSSQLAKKLNSFSQKAVSETSRYSAVAGQFHFNPISRSQFELTSRGGFDHENRPIELVQIICSDFGEPSLTSTFNVKVLVEDINDNQPKFSQSVYQFSIEENKPMNTVIDKLTATDQDSGRNSEIEYFLNDESLEYFKIGPTDGTLRSKVIFDRETRQSYRFQAYARDHGIPKPLTATVTVEVTIMDTNDNSPEFVGLDNENGYKFRVAENEAPNTHVGILLGTDPDAGENAQLRFRLATSSSFFKLDSNTGELTTTQSLDREKQAEHELIAMLVDMGKPPRSATAKIYIYVSDENDHDPIVVFPANGRGNVNVSFREPPGEVVARIEARDPDEGHNALLHYSLVTGNRNSVFRLGSTSAELIIDRNLNEADIGTYELDILIQDAGLPPRSSQARLTVQVTDTPARMYSSRFSGIRNRLLEAPAHPDGDTGPALGQYRVSDSGQGGVEGRDMKISDSNSSENGYVSAGAILVAIVALSCAIILVLLGIAVYLCGRKGLRLRGPYHYQNGQRNNTDNIDATEGEMLKSGALGSKGMNLDQCGSSPVNYQNPVLIETGNGTLVRCQLGSLSSTPVLNDPDYGEQKVFSVAPPLTYDGYTTCLPIGERIPNSTNYETFTNPRVFVPASSTSNYGRLGEAILVNNGETMRRKDGPILGSTYPTAKSNLPAADSNFPPSTKRTSLNKLKNTKNRNNLTVDSRYFTQSLKRRKTQLSDLFDSIEDPGDYTSTQIRVAHSWEDLSTTTHSMDVESTPAHSHQPTSRKLQTASPKPPVRRNAEITKDSPLRVSWKNSLETNSQRRKSDQTLTTFLPNRAIALSSTKNPCVLQAPSTQQPRKGQILLNASSGRAVNFSPTIMENDDNRRGYACLCEQSGPAHCPNSPQKCFIQLSNLSTMPEQIGAHRSPCSKSGNLIDLVDSSHTSSCSQSCECNLPPEANCPARLIEPNNSPTFNDQSEFV
ncbi:unnamed protein product [Calicophoron daubneyi]|uniref:Cadherin domain-containing protein n=1 Tax=Calicophoron daubneyi TaxID=300641 RepID=A0AAV2TQN1_CALDB